MRTMPLEPQYLRTQIAGRAIGVDREAKVLRGYVVAQKGPFKSEGRGEFDDRSLDSIVSLMAANRAGTRSRFAHPDMSSDGLGKFLGRAKDPRRDGNLVRADLHFDPSAFDTPSGDLAGYVMTLAESDPDALSSSLVLTVDQEYRLNPDGTKQAGPDGEPLPPLWRPKKIMASDVVDTGDAVDGLLSADIDAEGLPLGALWRGAEMLDTVFAGQPREVVEARCLAWLDRYLSRRYGPPPAGASVDLLRRRLALKEKFGA